MPRLSKLTDIRQGSLDFGEESQIQKMPKWEAGIGDHPKKSKKKISQKIQDPAILEQAKGWLISKLAEYFQAASKDFVTGNKVISASVPEGTTPILEPNAIPGAVPSNINESKVSLVKNTNQTNSQNATPPIPEDTQVQKINKEEGELKDTQKDRSQRRMPINFGGDPILELLGYTKHMAGDLAKIGGTISLIATGISLAAGYILDNKTALEGLAHIVDGIYHLIFNPQREHEKDTATIKAYEEVNKKADQVDADIKAGKITKDQGDRIKEDLRKAVPAENKGDLGSAKQREETRSTWASNARAGLLGTPIGPLLMAQDLTAKGRENQQKTFENIHGYGQEAKKVVAPILPDWVPGAKGLKADIAPIPTHEEIQNAVAGKSEEWTASTTPISQPGTIPTIQETTSNVAESVKNKATEIGTGMVNIAKNMLPTPDKHLSDQEIETILGKEGFREKPYEDPKGQKKFFSIGYGTRVDNNPALLKEYGTPDKPTGKKITKEEALKLVKPKIKQAEDIINSSVKVPISQPTFASLVDLGYNAGPEAVGPKSSIIQKINDKDLAGAQKLLPKYRVTGKGLIDKQGNKVVIPGVVTRRKDEAKGMVPVIESPESIPNPPERGENMIKSATQNALSNMSSGGNVNAPVIVAPKTSISNSQTSSLMPVNVNNDDDTHLWATRRNAQY